MKKFISLLVMLVWFNAFGSQLSVESVNTASTEDYLYYDFGTVWINTRSAVRYTVTNNGLTPLTYQSAYVWGSDYRADHNCTGILLPGARCQFEIVFWPFFEGISSGRFELNFVENDRITVDVRGWARRM
ncbi:MAG: hypothetical protein K0R29_1541 [Pseudobdellovibrio sp.]|jgi:hypothetical protein|nr:hypothetical protein [Pseudobdellovibrio sp.]